jgi:hypothetical protein
LKARKKKKVDDEQEKLHKLELELLSTPEGVQEAEICALKIEVHLQQETDSAQLSAAIVNHSAADLSILQNHHAAQQEAAVAGVKAKFLEDSKDASDAERVLLLQQHERDIARLRCLSAVSLSRAEEELQDRIADRKAKKKAALKAKQDRELELLANAKDKSALMKDIESFKSENAIEIEYERKSAAMLQNVIAESSSEVKLLREEFKQKAEQVLQNNAEKLDHDLALLGGSGPDDAARRAKLMEVVLIIFISCIGKC